MAVPAFLAASLGAAGCGPASVRPSSYPNPDVACPGGHLSWALQIEDQRVTREAQTRMIAAVREAVQRSFPGCRWNATEADAGTIAIEVHRFGSHLDAGYWEAAVEWTVSARSASGHILTQFEVDEEVTRPNYQGSDNEKESLSEAFGKGVERTARGLTALSTSGVFRHREGTVPAREGVSGDADPARATLLPSKITVASTAGARNGGRLERISQLSTTEDL
jgi:hypothetical protein